MQQILLERPRLVSDHFYLATSITCPNENEAEDNGQLKYVLYFQDNPMLLVLIWDDSNEYQNIGLSWN